MASNDKATIIIPIYADWPSLRDCIESLIKFVDTEKHKIILVNDYGSEADILEENIQKQITGKNGFEYYRNEKNLGFIGTCNRAVLELDKTENDVLLLNSDTKVTKGFLEEMLQVLHASPKHGTVSPRSNNATLATIPLSAAPQKGIDPKESYSIYQKIKPKLPHYTIVPVTHGFCMLIRRSLIKKYGLFDQVFGKGYGEEVDFCMRIKEKGYLSVLSNRSYVFHLEARSFSLETKSKLLENNNQIIWKRYPTYRQQVRDYMEEAIARENEIAKSVGIRIPVSTESKLKSLVKQSRHISSFAQKMRRSTRNN